MANGKINKNPDFFSMAAKLKKDLQIDAVKKGLDFIHKNFYEESFFDASFEPWPERQEPRSYNLLRVTNTLFSSIRATSQNEKVIFTADASYAAIHNEGGVIRTNVTNKMRRFFWAMF
jgi:phage gpG-like protein